PPRTPPPSRFEFNNPAPRQGLLRAYGLALLIHGLLLAALTWGVNWRRSDTSLSVEAELWSAVPQQAAPPLVEPEPTPEPAPPPPPKVEEPRQSEADIALAREKERQAKEKLEQARLEKEKLAREKERERQEREKKLAEEKKKKELEAKRKEEAEAKQRRDENLKRMAGLAGATGAPTTTGNAQKSAGGISSSYAGRIRARIKPNIVFPDELATNPSAEVEVRTSPDGTIVGRKLVKSSGIPNWDEAVLKAIDKTDTLPRNEEGIVPSPMTIIFRPKD
ncbi:energy transducer TonB, partial [Curvibacter sp. PAE-UM]|uniref:cell envelope integrity protein TolA n=1 Tax=Curvibacter sp. PAE-UM TaxID=1714344 RepID=UPI0035282A29